MREVGRCKLIGALLEDRELFKYFKQKKYFADFSKAVVAYKKLDKDIQKMLILAHDFSELMYGAHIAYNCILQHNKFGSIAFSDEWESWIKNIRKNMINFSGFNPDDVFNLAIRVRPHTCKFVYDWWNYILTSSPQKKQRNDLIETQEFHTKLVKARIRQNKYDDVQEEKWIGLTKLEYRMPQAQGILKDIINGLGKNDVGR